MGNAARKVLVVVFLSALAAYGGCANRYFYFPDDEIYQTPADYRLDHEEVWFDSADGTRLAGWWMPAVGDAQSTVIHFHGNGRNMTAHIGFVHWLVKEGFNLFVFDYRGYGQSAGRPQRRGVYQDGVAAIRYVQSRTNVDPDRIVILGQSLGGAVAIAVMGHEDFPGVRGGRRIDVCFVPANRTRRPGQDHAASLVEVAGGVAAG